MHYKNLEKLNFSRDIFLLAGAATTFMGRPKIGAGVDEMANSDFERAGRCLRITSHLLSM